MRTIAFIDGYNLYLSMRDVVGYDLCWADYGLLCRSLLKDGMRLDGIHYFSAWNRNRIVHHRDFVDAQCLEEPDGFFVPVWGIHKPRWRDCPLCHRKYPTQEEKKTDVNLALAMLELAINDEYDIALLFTKDMDQQPTINSVHRAGKKVWLIVPPGESAEQVDWGAPPTGPDTTIRLSLTHLKKARLPGRVVARGGREINIDQRRMEGPGGRRRR